MPTAFTHAFSGAAISVLGPKPFRGPRLALALAALAALPDLDVLGFLLGIPYAHPLGHRGFSHSLTFAFLLAIALPPLLYRRSTLPFIPGVLLFLAFFAACASHGFLDAFTDAGLGVGFFVPFSNTRFFFPWRPIRTSPLGIQAFIQGNAREILYNELMWVWLPICCFVAIVIIVRRLAPRRTSV